MAKIPTKHQYRMCAMRYTNNSDLLPATIDVACGGLQARVEADKNYILPVFIVRVITERYALQHKEVRGQSVVDGRQRQYVTKRINPTIDYELLPESIDESDDTRYERLMEFKEKLKDKNSDEYKEFRTLDGDKKHDGDSLFNDPIIPVTELNFARLRPQPPEYYENLNKASFVRDPNSREASNSGEVEALKEVNTLLKKQIEDQNAKIDKIMSYMIEEQEKKAEIAREVVDHGDDADLPNDEDGMEHDEVIDSQFEDEEAESAVSGGGD